RPLPRRALLHRLSHANALTGPRLAPSAMEIGGVDAVVVAFEALQPVALEQELAADVYAVGRKEDPGEVGERRDLGWRADVRADHAVDLAARIRRGLQLVLGR